MILVGVLVILCWLGYAFAEPLYPVIIVPGDGGSQLQAKLNKRERVHFLCAESTSYYFDLWLNLEMFVPYLEDCAIDNILLRYNPTTRRSTNQAGVDIRVPGWGNTDRIEYLDPNRLPPTIEFGKIVEGLVAQGYVRGVSVRGAPYDFRHTPGDNPGLMDKLKSLIEDTYKKNNNNPIVLVCHSMGNPTTLYFLTKHVSAEWKAKYIKAMIAISAPFGGATKAMRMVASGEDLHILTVRRTKVRIAQRSWPSSAWMLPRRSVFNRTEPIVFTPKRNYTAYDYEQFFNDMGYPNGYEMWKDTEPLLAGLPTPGVELHCVHGINVMKTPFKFVYSHDFDEAPKTITGNGDGTVNLRSLKLCAEFNKRQEQPVYHSTYNGAEHLKILQDKRMVKRVIDVATGRFSGSPLKRSSTINNQLIG